MLMTFECFVNLVMVEAAVVGLMELDEELVVRMVECRQTVVAVVVAVLESDEILEEVERNMSPVGS